MLLAASTALVEDRQSYLALRRFSYGLSAVLTLVQLAVLAPPVFDALSRDLLALPPDVAQLTHGALAWLLPWTAAIGYRRFRQGLLIRRNLTRRVAYGTIVRLVAMSLTALLAYRFLPLAGAHVGALALSVGVVAEAVASRRMTAGLVGELQQRQLPAEGNSSLRLGTIVSFYMPLALTSVLAMAVQPMVTFFMGQVGTRWNRLPCYLSSTASRSSSGRSACRILRSWSPFWAIGGNRSWRSSPSACVSGWAR